MTINVCDDTTDKVIGKGEGTIDSHAKTAQITSWDEKPALLVGKLYTLTQGTRKYRHAKCETNQLPVNFSNVE